MKKISALLLILLTLTLLVGCKPQKITTTVCEGPVGRSGVTLKVTLKAKGDRVITSKQEGSFPLSLLYSNQDMAEVRQDLKAKKYNSYKGVNYSFYIKNDQIHETMKIDYEKGNLKELVQAKIARPNMNSSDDKQPSLKKLTKFYKNNYGFKCTTK
ncbi:DUF1307 domain-containing protein [Lactobacillus sp. YT155]|uniref:DUF1307 domain-containing protein n=1 Tax=Lactobacillus sp. YT155 TaxID=3060955 RepID=UPI0026604532|nr:DUF1307 domain-containing protein [Lactobacillus sp. YT155]MDO1604696.1 DUF1307 domain-containing protein [Lactobacillus sp. YT155]